MRGLGPALWERLTSRFAARYHELLRREIVGSCETLLDLGCGRQSPVGALKPYLQRSVGVDLHEPSIAVSRRSGLHHDYVTADVIGLHERFGGAAFDCVTALDIIEHLPKPAGLRLLDEMELIARRKVIVFTPNGFLDQTAYDDNELQEHLSGWTVAEFRDRGYRVYGVHGWRPLRGERMRVRLWPRALWTLFSYWTQPLTELRPERAYQLLCVKEIEQQSPSDLST